MEPWDRHADPRTTWHCDPTAASSTATASRPAGFRPRGINGATRPSVRPWAPPPPRMRRRSTVRFSVVGTFKSCGSRGMTLSDA